MKFALIGPGRVGSSIAAALSASGFWCTQVIGRQRDLSPALRRLVPAEKFSSRLQDLTDGFDVLILTIGDGEIRKVVRNLAARRGIGWTGKVVLHMSGIVGNDALKPLARKGAAIGSLHPLAAFPVRLKPQNAVRISYDFLGTKGALMTARRIVSRLDSRLLLLKSEEEKIILHIAGVIASNFVTIAVRSAEQLIRNILDDSSSEEIVDGLLHSALTNMKSEKGTAALSGPLARADIDTVVKHMRALRKFPELLAFYKSASRLGIEALLKDNGLKTLAPRFRKIKKVLSSRAG